MPQAQNTGVPSKTTLALTTTYTSSGAGVTGKLITYAGALGSAGTSVIYGVLQQDCVQNDTVSVAVGGLVEVLSGAAVAVGAAVVSDSAGRGVTATAGDKIFGRAVSAAAAANQKFQVLITREGTN